jgi:hypothetical protein
MKPVEGGVDAWLGIVRCVQQVDAIAGKLVRGPIADGALPEPHGPMLDAILGILALREALRPILAEVEATSIPAVSDDAPAAWSREQLA